MKAVELIEKECERIFEQAMREGVNTMVGTINNSSLAEKIIDNGANDDLSGVETFRGGFETVKPSKESLFFMK